MTQPGMDPTAALLTTISQSEPQPWYPKAFTESRGLPRDSFDPSLERLRMLGLIELTEWVANQGQGYRLTAAGKKVLYNQGLMSKLTAGTLPPAAPEQPPPPETEWGNRGATPYEKGEAIRAGLLSKDKPTVTVVLIVINVLVFVFGLGLAVQKGIQPGVAAMGGAPAIVRDCGAVSGPLLVQGEWWRLVTAFFLHYGVFHLGMNMYSLWVLGPLSEKMWGRWRFLALYLLSGLCGNCVVALSSAHPTAGASGAIWGVMTAFLVWVLLNRSALPQQLASSWIRSVGFCLILNVGITFFVPHISIAGHFGGGAFGAVLALLLNAQRFANPLNRKMALVAIGLLPIVSVGLVVLNVKADPIEEGVKAFDNAGHVYEDKVDDVAQKPPEERSEAEVSKAIQALKGEVEKMKKANHALRALGDAGDRKEVRKRLALEECLEKRVVHFQFVTQKLEAGKDWPRTSDLNIAEARRHVKEAMKAWAEAIDAD